MGCRIKNREFRTVNLQCLIEKGGMRLTFLSIIKRDFKILPYTNVKNKQKKLNMISQTNLIKSYKNIW